MTTLLDQPLYHQATAADRGTATVSVLLADGHQLFRSGLGALLDREADLAVVAESPTAEEAAAEAARTRPTVAVLDPDMPGPGGPATAAMIRERAPGTAVLLLTAQPRTADLQRAVADGVAGVLLKDVPLGRPDRRGPRTGPGRTGVRPPVGGGRGPGGRGAAHPARTHGARPRG